MGFMEARISGGEPVGGRESPTVVARDADDDDDDPRNQRFGESRRC